MATAGEGKQADAERTAAHRLCPYRQSRSAASQMAATADRIRVTSMYVLDTNIISELRKVRPHGGVMAWLRSVDDKNLNLSAVSFGEIQAGIERTRGTDPTKAAEIEAW